MAYGFFNPNPSGKRVGDCVIRAISFLIDEDWQTTYLKITMQGFEMFDMPSSNAVWAEFLRRQGFKRYIIPDTCPDCYTVKDFCRDNPQGKFLLATGQRDVASNLREKMLQKSEAVTAFKLLQH